MLTRREIMHGAAALTGSALFASGSPARASQLAAGTRFETPWLEIDSGKPGPTVLIVAGIHGNEPAPPHAVRALRDEPPSRGRWLLIPEVNRPALAAGSRYTPGERFADLNRNFPTAGRPEPRGVLASALWQRAQSLAPDFVLDLHEGWGFSASSKSMGSSIVWSDSATVAGVLEDHALRLQAAVNETIADRHKRFTLIRRGPAGSFARALSEELAVPALVLETTWVQPLDLRVAQQRLLLRTMSTALGMG